MINNRFLYFKTEADFIRHRLEIPQQSIVFIQDKKLIWTHGEFYGDVPVAITVDSELSKISINPVQNSVVKKAIDNLYNSIQSVNNDVQYVKNAIDNDTEETLRKFQAISEFLESIQNTDGGQALNDIINAVNTEKERATTAEEGLSDEIEDVQDEIAQVKNSMQQLENHIISIRNAVNNIVIPEYPAASEDNDGLMTKEYVQWLSRLDTGAASLREDIASLNTEIGNCKSQIENIQSVISDTGQIDDIIEKYNRLADLINRINSEDDDDPNQVLNNILNSITDLQQTIDDEITTAINNEVTRATTSEGSLDNKIDLLAGRVRVLEDRPSTPVNPSGGDGITHIFTTLDEYQALESYQNDAIYFILEPESNTWTFGGKFPITFGTTFTFGGTFPITLT